MCPNSGLNRTSKKGDGRLAAISPESLISTAGESAVEAPKNERECTDDSRHSVACRQVAGDRGSGADLFGSRDSRCALQSAEHVLELGGYSRWPRDRSGAGIAGRGVPRGPLRG